LAVTSWGGAISTFVGQAGVGGRQQCEELKVWIRAGLHNGPMRRWGSVGLLVLLLACTPDGDTDVVTSTTFAASTTTERVTSTIRASVDLSQRPLVWLAPQPFISIHDFEGGSVDFFELFAPGSDWDTAAEQIHVVKLYDQLGLGREPTDEEWLQAIEGIRSRGMTLAMELGPLPEGRGCGGGEGFGHSHSLDIVRKVQRLGGRVDVVVFDGPYGFGHFFDEVDSACNWTLEQVAEESAAFVRALRELEPDVVVGGIEPLWSGLAAADFADWLDGYEGAAGEPLAFLHLDVDWKRHDWAEVAMQIEDEAHARGVPFGVIYNGGDQVESDEGWAQTTADRFYLYEQVIGGRPDHVVLQSWHVYPSRVLPDSDPSTLTGLVNRYFGERTVLDADVAVVGGELQLNGVLTGSNDRPLAGAVLEVELEPLDGAVQTLVREGTVPEDVDTAEIGIRINTEGGGPGEADLIIYEVGYREEGDETNLVADPTFEALAGFEIPGVEVLPSNLGEGTMLRLTATAEEVLNLGSAPFPVTSGASYRLTVIASIPEESAKAGYAGVVFLAGEERERHIVPLAPVPEPLGELTTGPDGSHELDWELGPGRHRLRIEYRGDLGHWPVSHEVILGG
jgi:hypothetical protein